MTLFDRYVFRNLLLSCVVICGVLTVLIMLIQSIRFLELVMNSGATMGAFAGLMALSVPRFVEAVLPVSLMAGVLFFYNKVIMDSELLIMRSAGSSPLMLARPALVLCGAMMVFLFIISAWVAPGSISKIQILRQEIRAQYTALLFREGVFNTVGSGITAYIRERGPGGELHGLMIHDTRREKTGGNAYTVVARRGLSLDTDTGQKVIVYDGTRQEMDLKTGVLSRLDFEQYTIDIPDAQDDISQRWKEPDERTLGELLDIKSVPERDAKHIPQFIGEANRRMSLPLLLLAFTTTGLAFLLIGPLDRRGLERRIFGASITVLLLQGAYLFFYNLAKKAAWANALLYLLPLVVIGVCMFLLSPQSEALRQRLMRRGEGD